MLWLMMRMHMVRHLWCFINNDEQMCSPFVMRAFLLLVSLTELQSWIKQGLRVEKRCENFVGHRRETPDTSVQDHFGDGTYWQSPDIRDLVMLSGSISRSRLSSTNTKPTCPRSGQRAENIIHALMQCPTIFDLWTHAEQLPKRAGWVRLSTESVVRIAYIVDRVCRENCLHS